MENLVSADAVGSESFRTYVFEQSALDIRLDGVMNLYSVFLRKFGYMVHGLAEELHVVIIEWSRYLVEAVYDIVI